MDKSKVDNGALASTNKVAALAASSGPSALELEMADILNASKVAAELAKSTIIPEALQGKPANVLIIIMMGRDFGWSALQSVRFIDVVKGRPTVTAAAKVGLCQAHPSCEYFRCVETTEKQSTWETKRRGVAEPQRYTFTWQDAERRGLAGQQNYKTMPKNMLSARASAALANQAYADVVAGLYSKEELDDPDVRDIGGGQSPAAKAAAWEAFVGSQAPPVAAKKAEPTVIEHDVHTGEVSSPPVDEEADLRDAPEGTPEHAAWRLIERCRAAQSAAEMAAIAKDNESLMADLQERVGRAYAAERPRVRALEAERRKGTK